MADRPDALPATAAQTAGSAGIDDDRCRIGLVARLREASLSLDTLWQASLRDGSEDLSVQLGDASHAVHRALVVLANSAFGVKPRDRYAPLD